jgi:hypothetical protein
MKRIDNRQSIYFLCKGKRSRYGKDIQENIKSLERAVKRNKISEKRVFLSVPFRER